MPRPRWLKLFLNLLVFILGGAIFESDFTLLILIRCGDFGLIFILGQKSRFRRRGTSVKIIEKLSRLFFLHSRDVKRLLRLAEKLGAMEALAAFTS